MQDRVTSLPFPLPNCLNEFFPPELGAARALLRQLPLDDVLSRDTGMVGARNPEHAEAIHAFVAAENVLQRIVERVAHVQRTGNVGRWNHDREVSTDAFRRGKKACVHPVSVPF